MCMQALPLELQQTVALQLSADLKHTQPLLLCHVGCFLHAAKFMHRARVVLTHATSPAEAGEEDAPPVDAPPLPTLTLAQITLARLYLSEGDAYAASELFREALRVHEECGEALPGHCWMGRKT